MAPESWVALGLVFTGLGIVVGGSAGVLLPVGDRSRALFSLIAGVGAGVVVLAFGTVVKGYESSLFMFFLAGFLGCVTVCVCVWLIVRSSRRI